MEAYHMPDDLKSWRAGETKRRIVSFVESVTIPGTPHFVPAEDKDRNLRPGWHAMDRAADVRSGAIRD
jgi:hypothetical protein